MKSINLNHTSTVHNNKKKKNWIKGLQKLIHCLNLYSKYIQVCLCSGHHCQSSYPCTSIQVTFNTTEGEHEEAQLHHTQYNTGRVRARVGLHIIPNIGN